MSKKKLLGLLTGLLTLGGALPALAYGEWFSGGFVTPNPLNWTYDSVTISTNYLNSYVKPAAGSQWNSISSNVQMVFVTSGSYRVKALVATSPDPNAAGLFEPYCADGSGATCISSTWTSGRVYGLELTHSDPPTPLLRGASAILGVSPMSNWRGFRLSPLQKGG